jgi:hypothetical protein
MSRFGTFNHLSYDLVVQLIEYSRLRFESLSYPKIMHLKKLLIFCYFFAYNTKFKIDRFYSLIWSQVSKGNQENMLDINPQILDLSILTIDIQER